MTATWQYALIADYAYDHSAGNGADKQLPIGATGFGRIAGPGAPAAILDDVASGFYCEILVNSSNELS